MIVEEQIVTLAGWATDVVCIDDPKSTPHTLIVFVPGNPGCIGWYTSHLLELVQRLPEGVAARGASYAGHSPHTLPQGSDISISWTVNGQIQHKCAFLDWILSEFETWPRLIFMSHSIGSHMVERLLLLRPDVLRQTRGVIHLMPFTRMKASLWDQSRLDWGAARPELLIRYSGWASQLLQRLPRWLVDYCMKGIMDDAKARDLAVSLLRQPNYPRTFFELGTEEIRDVPEIGDVSQLLENRSFQWFSC